MKDFSTLSRIRRRAELSEDTLLDFVVKTSIEGHVPPVCQRVWRITPHIITCEVRVCDVPSLLEDEGVYHIAEANAVGSFE